MEHNINKKKIVTLKIICILFVSTLSFFVPFHFSFLLVSDLEYHEITDKYQSSSNNRAHT